MALDQLAILGDPVVGAVRGATRLRLTGPLVVVGGVIPPKDVPTLKNMGVSSVFCPGTNILEAAEEGLNAIETAAASS